MAAPAKRLQPVNVILVLSGLALQWRDVIAFEPAGPTALDAPVSIALEDGAANGLPSAGIQIGAPLKMPFPRTVGLESG